MKWSEQLGAKLQTKDGLQDTDNKLAGKKVFTPFLSAVYDDMIEQHPEFELIFISSDRDPSQYAEYYNEMPFLALPFDERAANQAISTKYGVTGIPMLVFVNAEGETISLDGRTVVANSRGDVEKLWEELNK
ncbi:Thioredoxin-like [Phytophthora infestans]|uniref:protein-disulfide reductase n=1 Tax=Phytophthora infestans TaxID=4787 RepID=A0A833VX10_PHYIN|nr:Thioredoxin-like [Phytophthora infestans]